MHPMLNIAVRAARAAGNQILRYANRVDTLTISKKQHNDFVSEVDRIAEQEIIQVIRKAYPSHAILAEESGEQSSTTQGGGDEFTWIIDPLDGTTNFLHGFPQYAVSVGLQRNGELDQGVIYDPLRNELFTASRGSGALLNDRRIRVSRRDGLEGALLGTGFPFRDLSYLQAYMGMFQDLLPTTAGVRRAGSAALDLAYVAAGRLDGFWELGLKKWDIAAGALMIQEAGGVVSDFGGGKTFMDTGNVIAGTLKLHPQIVKTVKPHLIDGIRR